MLLLFLLDENLRGPLWHAIRRHNVAGGLTIDVVRVGDVAGLPLTSPDDLILDWCERENRILVTLDYDTMPNYVAKHLAKGAHLPGVLTIRPAQSLQEVVALLELIAHAGIAADYRDRITYIP